VRRPASFSLPHFLSWRIEVSAATNYSAGDHSILSFRRSILLLALRVLAPGASAAVAAVVATVVTVVATVVTTVMAALDAFADDRGGADDCRSPRDRCSDHASSCAS
jgi:hypothetical protein